MNMQNTKSTPVRNALLGVLSLGALSMALPMASAALFVDVGTHNLVGNSAVTQYVDLYILNDGAGQRVGGWDFIFQIGDGNGSTPSIVSTELVADTIFESNTSGQPNDLTTAQLAYASVTKAIGSIGSGPVYPGASGGSGTLSKIARVGISTLGYPSGVLPFNIQDTVDGTSALYADNQFADVLGVEILDGFLNIAPVPEPTEWAALISAGLLGFGVWRRRSAK